MKSLVNKSLQQFVICTVVLMLLAIPIFYFITEYYYAEDLIDVIESIKRGEGVPDIDLEKDVFEGITLQFFLIFIVLCTSLIITQRIITRKLWHPFDDTLQKIEQYNLAQNDQPQLLPTNIKEFSRLNNSLELLIKRNRDSYLSQKEFIQNASHELQTPLAIAQSKLDLLLQEDLTEQQSKIVSELYQVNARMSRLNKNLLLLARIENAQSHPVKNVDITAIINQQLVLYSDLQEDSHITFTRTDDVNKHSEKFEHSQTGSSNDKPLQLLANEVLFESLLNNLVVNAIRHTPNQGEIKITLSEQQLIVCNEAIGGALDEKYLFSRFHNTDDLKRGNGLGLAIVKAICQYHGWTISYHYEAHRHYFCVTFLFNSSENLS